jgi:hypothetical protein
VPTRKILARGWAFELSDGAATPTYIQIGGLNQWSRSREKNDADTTDFDSQGHTEHIVASRGGSVTLEGMFRIDPDTTLRDPGQQAVEDLAELFDYDSVRHFRYFHIATGVGRQGFVSANISDVGGGNDDPTSWGCELTFSGATSPYTAP